MAGMPRRLPLPSRALLALGLVAALGAAGCGAGDPRDDYAERWDGICRDVASATAAFRTAASTAATTSPDAGDATVASGLRPADVASDLAVPARKLARALAGPLDRAADLEPPDEWRTWHARELRRLAARERSLAAGVTRLQAGDPDALPLLAVGGVGPASTQAPAALRDRTPDCTIQR
jgi:hypothetical protein